MTGDYHSIEATLLRYTVLLYMFLSHLMFGVGYLIQVSPMLIIVFSPLCRTASRRKEVIILRTYCKHSAFDHFQVRGCGGALFYHTSYFAS